MQRYSEAAWERAMKVQEVILWTMAKKLTWWQAAETVGILVGSVRRAAAVCRTIFVSSRARSDLTGLA